jgi:phage host-nuclease inhibitor protein Gam
MTVDTLEIARKLEAAGVDRRQAEAISEAIRDGSRGDLDEAVTRLEDKISSEIARLEGKLASEIARLEGKFASEFSRIEGKLDTGLSRLEARIDAKVAEVKAEVFRLLVGQVVVFAAIVALLRFLPIR